MKKWLNLRHRVRFSKYQTCDGVAGMSLQHEYVIGSAGGRPGVERARHHWRAPRASTRIQGNRPDDHVSRAGAGAGVQAQARAQARAGAHAQRFDFKCRLSARRTEQARRSKSGFPEITNRKGYLNYGNIQRLRAA
jgi:hypothetical protein